MIGTTWGLIRANHARLAEAAQRHVAESEKQKAEASERVARQQQARAEKREQQAIDAVKRFRDAVAQEPKLKNNPELEELRKKLLKEPLEFFRSFREQLQADRDTRPEALARLASAAMELGWLIKEIGDQQDALRAYQEARAIQERLCARTPPSPNSRVAWPGATTTSASCSNIPASRPRRWPPTSRRGRSLSG
jgi:hypothetical protein